LSQVEALVAQEVLIEFIDHYGNINSLDRFVGRAQNSLRHDKPPQRNPPSKEKLE